MDMIDQIRNDLIGAYRPINGPFGDKPLVYADYTASGRSLASIEQFIQHQVLPLYANTHSDTSYTGASTTYLREQARGIIRKALNGTAEDKVIFCGSGATAAVNKLIDILGLRLPYDVDQSYGFNQQIPEARRPVVFVGPYEHHSNELPWRESIAEVVCIGLDNEGHINQQELARQLQHYQHRPLKIGSFSAASNVTGVCSDLDGISAILRQHQALVCWDFAAAAPYMPIDMNGPTPFDAVFISPHKLVGGPGTPGLLIAKQRILSNSIPAVVGGGTVSFVTPESHQFITDCERREEGGTPAIVESIRAGLVFQLQQQVSMAVIQQRENALTQRAMAFFRKIPQIKVLGSHTAKRLSIFSLRFTHQGKDLHYGFVAALINDLFGIQVRGGCSCAGPYAHHLLGLSKEASQRLQQQLNKGHMVLRPGWVRVNFNYFISDQEFDYILHSIKLVAEHGWR